MRIEGEDRGHRADQPVYYRGLNLEGDLTGGLGPGSCGKISLANSSPDYKNSCNTMSWLEGFCDDTTTKRLKH
ncbi:unnamed protein product [Caretta caretta]